MLDELVRCYDKTKPCCTCTYEEIDELTQEIRAGRPHRSKIYRYSNSYSHESTRCR
jgi:hypothetical protein